MLDGGGGGGYAGTTNWYQYDVEAMWRMLENQQTNNHWSHASGWRKTSELTERHMSRLRQYRDGLAEAWPPERSAAARAYIERLDYLISTVQQTYEIASANYTAFTGATGAIGSSRRELKAIYDEYVAKRAAKQEQDRRAAAGTPTPSPSPSGARPVTQADLEQLNNRARSIMYSLSGELVQAQVQIRQPPPYKAPAQIDEGNSNVYAGGGGSAPPVIPPVVPVPTVPSSPGAGGAPPAPMQVVPTTTAPATGPILGGAPPATAPPSTIAPPVITPTPPPSTPLPGVPAPLPPGPSLLPKPGLPGGPPLPSTLPPAAGGGPLKPGIGPAAGIPKVMPPGGMIGAVPGAGLGQPAPATTPARRINPVGGLIGGAGPGSGASVVGGTGQRPGTPITGVRRVSGGQGVTGPRPMSGSAAASGATTMPGGTARPGNRPMGQGTSGVSAGRSDDPRGKVRWDPDDPWATDDGVAPVVMPPPRPGRIDPGPAIGSNR